MVTKEQFKAGVAQYIEQEFIAKVGGLKKWMLVLAGTEIMSRMDEMISKLPENHYVTKDGMIDIDKLYSDMSKVVQRTGDVTEHFPLIGDVKFTSKDIDELYRYITS